MSRNSKPKLFRQLVGLLSLRERRLAAVLLCAMVVQAGFELAGIASVLPFMSVAADPGVVHRNAWLGRVYEWGGFTSDAAFLTVLGLAVVALLALTNAVGAVTNWATLRFVWGTYHRLANRMLRGYLTRPYSFFIERNTANLHNIILQQVGAVITGVLMPVLTFVARLLVTIAIVVLLVALNPLLAVVIVMVLGGAYAGIYLAVERQQAILGRVMVQANQERYKLTAETFGGIKDVKVLQREMQFAWRFEDPSLRFTRAIAVNGVISALPRYLLETLAFGGIVLIVVFYLRTGRNATDVLPALSIYAFGGYRLMPSLQQLFGAVTSIRFHRASLDDLSEDIRQFAGAVIADPDVAPLPLARAIRFDDLHFRYPGAAGWALVGASLTIRRNETIGLVGASGSGKTTLVDLLLGLYEPEKGRILIDNVPLTPAVVGGWRRQVGYVPQQIFLSDDTVAANIAFGVPAKQIDMEQVERAARMAQLHEFIRGLPSGYGTIVGERGVRLSGGQRQRIGIARALYRDPAVLIMDEATSSLDGATEEEVMQAIRLLAGEKTVILIAHRLTTVEECDRIYLLEAGRVVDQGTYAELAAGSAAFRIMARLQEASERETT